WVSGRPPFSSEVQPAKYPFHGGIRHEDTNDILVGRYKLQRCAVGYSLEGFHDELFALGIDEPGALLRTDLCIEPSSNSKLLNPAIH
ncbi:MAG: hypothetical protein ACI9VR_005251, partial [Cognaticolwellia sp.]